MMGTTRCELMRAHVIIGTALGAVALAGAGYLIGEKIGVERAREQPIVLARVPGVLSSFEADAPATNKRVRAVAAEAEALNKENADRAAAKGSAKGGPYAGSDEELADETTRLRSIGGLVLPKRFYVVAGHPIEIYWRTVVLARDPETFVYSVNCSCDFATNERRRLALTPAAAATGQHSLEITVANTHGETISRDSVEIVVVPRSAGENSAFEMLMIGDSLGHQSRFPNRLAQLFSLPGNPKVTFVGSHKPRGAEIPHEQYSGWRFIFFTTLFGQDPHNYHRDRSPFVFGVVDGKPVVDVQRYLDETLKGARPRNVHIQLGINDAFALAPDAPDLDKQLSEIIDHAEALISALRKALPEAIITVGSVIQANATDRAHIESYRADRQLHSEWRWRQVQMRLARNMVSHFEQTGDRKVYLVPTHMAVDPLDGYNAHVWTPEGTEYSLSNALHPSHVGDKQLATAIFGVVKAELGGLLGP
jgi:lysophospholipase L1-like esterase